MRKPYFILLVVSTITLAGCNEFMKSSEKTAAVDVVGDPTDPVQDSSRRSEIVGSAPPMPDDIDSITDTSTERLTPSPLPDDIADQTENEAEPDVVGELNIAKPVSLKTIKADSDSDQ